MKKYISKVIAFITAASLLISLSPIASAQQNVNVGTGMTKSDGGGDAPIIKAKWEMEDTSSTQHSIFTWNGDDDSTDPGAQFMPPVQWGAQKDIVFCAVATDPDGVADINAVYADMYYPTDRAFHPMDPAMPDVLNGGMCILPTPGLDPVSPVEACDYGLNGCGKQVGDEILLSQLSKAEGYELFCNRVRTHNENLPTFFSVDGEGYDYAEICATDGELLKETAYVYCGVRHLIWEDPAGDYTVLVHAADNAGLDSDQLSNNFEYLEVTAFETDFTSISYGNVKLNTHKIVNGDLTWGNSLASVRNIGNTRLHMWVIQNDMGLGTTNGHWNVQYDGRVGSDVPFIVYDPNTNTRLEDILDLSELEEMDFSIEVFKFPPNTGPGYQGTMVLSATRADFRQCLGDVEPPLPE